VPVSIPKTYINPYVRHVGVSKLRSMNASKLRAMDNTTLVIEENEKPLAVLLNYEEYLAMQGQLMAILETQHVLSSREEKADVVSGLEDIKEGRTKPSHEVRRSLTKAKAKEKA
jgi:PHD/YefM family antitoxin component YafN of YafNO toxin-antitoxin module